MPFLHVLIPTAALGLVVIVGCSTTASDVSAHADAGHDDAAVDAGCCRADWSPGKCFPRNDAGACLVCCQGDVCGYAPEPDGTCDAPGGKSPPARCAPSMGQIVDGPAGQFYRTGSLPRGACEGATSPCEMAVWHDCPCPSELAAVDGYRCNCENGSWNCRVSAPGGAVCTQTASCTTPNLDAAAD